MSVELSVNALSQCAHGYGRSPVCVLNSKETFFDGLTICPDY